MVTSGRQGAMETMTAKPGGMALNGISEASVRGRRPLPTATAVQFQQNHHQYQQNTRRQQPDAGNLHCL